MNSISQTGLNYNQPSLLLDEKQKDSSSESRKKEGLDDLSAPPEDFSNNDVNNIVDENIE